MFFEHSYFLKAINEAEIKNNDWQSLEWQKQNNKQHMWDMNKKIAQGSVWTSVGWMRVTAPSLPTRDWHFDTLKQQIHWRAGRLLFHPTCFETPSVAVTLTSVTARLQSWQSSKRALHCIFNVSETCSSVKEWKEQEHQLHTDRVTNLRTEEDHPSKPRPYKQYCTTLLTLVKAEAILIGACLQGDTPFFCQCEVRGASDSAA